MTFRPAGQRTDELPLWWLSNTPKELAEKRLSFAGFSVPAFASRASERLAVFPAAASLQTGS